MSFLCLILLFTNSFFLRICIKTNELIAFYSASYNKNTRMELL